MSTGDTAWTIRYHTPTHTIPGDTVYRDRWDAVAAAWEWALDEVDGDATKLSLYHNALNSTELRWHISGEQYGINVRTVTLR
ncbi:hypothetical protein [Halobaculum limi]|uniref:hypothetical protein n=1 Tax=Halobaculum limi TaxID=3031916 RepID=UPI00240493CE|nr:hypothetical protein [Halobaculum sp. YSMS11]